MQKPISMKYILHFEPVQGLGAYPFVIYIVA